MNALINHYKILDPGFVASLTPEDLFFLDLSILIEFNHREKELLEKQKKKERDEEEHEGMERYESEDDFWAEVEAANDEAIALKNEAVIDNQN